MSASGLIRDPFGQADVPRFPLCHRSGNQPPRLVGGAPFLMASGRPSRPGYQAAPNGQNASTDSAESLRALAGVTWQWLVPGPGHILIEPPSPSGYQIGPTQENGGFWLQPSHQRGLWLASLATFLTAPWLSVPFALLSAS
jgi:hypothetical protein